VKLHFDAFIVIKGSNIERAADITVLITLPSRTENAVYVLVSNVIVIE
jgi:hypothetical protein